MKKNQTIFAVGLVTLCGAMIFVVCWSGSWFLRFARDQEHVSALKMISMAFVEYHDSHHVLPIESQDDLWAGGWRKHVIQSPSMKGAYGSQDAFRQVLEKYALLVPNNSKWLDGEPQSFKELKGEYGYPVVAVQLPKDLGGRQCSALVLDSEHQRLRLHDGTTFPLTIFRDMYGIRCDGSIVFIPSDANVELILKILQKDDHF